MHFYGKIIGAAFALMLGADFFGFVFGVIIGHIFDMVDSQGIFFFPNQQRRQELFFSTTFEVMGHLTKSKGRVTGADIHIANQIMDRMNLYGESRIAAQNAFRIGKAENYPLREKIHEFRNICFYRFDLIRYFLEIQIQIAFSDGLLHRNEREVLYVIAKELGISRIQFDQFLHTMQSSFQFSKNYQKQSNSSKQNTKYGPSLDDAYNVLGVNANDDFSTIKRAYRKLMNKYHPDKLIAKGLPPEMMEMTKLKAQEIQKAYEMIKEKKCKKEY